MKRRSITFMVGAVLLTTGLLGQSPAQAYDKWVEFTIVRITQPATGSTVPQGKTIKLKCIDSNDIDVDACVSHPTQREDELEYSWSSTTGTFSDDAGPDATWTAPETNGDVVITVTANDDGAPAYANDANRSHSITLTVVDPGIYYVKTNATGSGDGSSWADAFTNLGTAIAAVSANSELWVAADTYKPHATDRGKYFAINKNIKIYGGFNGTETALGQRDRVANETILSGDIGTENDDSDNSYHVVWFSSAATLDGFTITKGRGSSDGAGAYVQSCSPTIRNCTFKDNIADNWDGDGGGMHCYVSSPTVVNCAFVENEAGDDGGGLCNKKGSNGKFINCAFYGNATHGDNSGKSDGGAIFNTSSEQTGATGSNPVFVNCVIAANHTQRDGGGECTAEVKAVSNATYLNCTFHGNSAGDEGGAVACKDGCTVTLKNCILWGDSAVAGGPEIWNSGSTVNVTYSDVQGCTPANGNINADPWFADTSDLDGPDGRWLTFDDGLRIKFGSPCIDAADGNAKDSYTDAGANERDALGLKHIDIRTVTDTGTSTPLHARDWYDMGACEAAVEHAIFISVDGLAATLLDDPELMGTVGNCPNMDEMRLHGMWTYNARCDVFKSETMPNHWTMLTGLPVSQVTGTGWTNVDYHGCTYNGDYDDPTWKVHEYRVVAVWNRDHYDYYYIGNQNRTYIPSVYDIVHDRGGTTAEYAGKDKFVLHEWSYDSLDGRPDQVTPPDDTRDKIDTFKWTTDSGDSTAADWNSNVLMSRFIKNKIPEYPFNFTLFHFKGPDKVGHNDKPTSGPVGPWGSTDWDNMVKTVDTHLGTVMEMIKHAPNKEMYYNTVIVLTADHGGSGYGHGTPTVAANYTIPFGVWGHLIPTGDAYTYSDGTRSSPAAGTQPAYTAASQPIRHADGVDLALNLMGLPSIDGARITGMGIGQ